MTLGNVSGVGRVARYDTRVVIPLQGGAAVPIFHMITGAPDPVAPFSHAVGADGWVFVTGQMPFSGTSNTSAYPEGIAAQTHQVMENLTRVLTDCGLTLGNVVAARTSSSRTSRKTTSA